MKNRLKSWLMGFREAPAPFPLERRHYLAGALVASVALTVYLLTLAPTISGEDSGELVTAAYELGIAHPPGYPLWCLTSFPFAHLPFVSVAFGVNLASAVFSAAAIFVLFLLILKLTKSPWAAAGGALLFAFSKDHWSQSVIAEVYSLNTFLVVLLSYLLILWREKRERRILYLFALVYGLSLTNHHTAALLGPIFVFFALAVEPKLILQKKTTLICLLLAVLGLSVYAYLPIRSAEDPYVNWGAPTSWEKMVDHISREQYQKPASQVAPRTLEKTLGHLEVLWEHFSAQFTLWLVPLIAGGWWLLFRRDRLAWAFLTLVAAACTLGIIYYTNFDLDREGIFANRIFFIPAYLCSAIFVSAVLAWILRRPLWRSLRGRARIPNRAAALAPALLVLPAAVPLLAHYQENDLSRYYFAYDYGVNLLETMDEGAIIFPSADHTTFPLIYLQRVEGRRPDVIHADKYGYIEEHLYADMPAEQQREMAPLAGEAKRYYIQDYIIRKFAPRPVYFTMKRDVSGLHGFEMVPEGLLFKVRPIEETAPAESMTLDELFKPEAVEAAKSEELWASYVRRDLEEESVHLDFTAQIILSDYHYARAWNYLQRGETEKALIEFEQITGIADDLKQTFNNIGAALAEFRLFEEARRYFEKAVALDEHYIAGVKNLASSYFSAGDYDKALELYDQIVKKDTTDAVVWLRRGSCHKELGLAGDALQDFRKAATTVPTSAIPYREMALLYQAELRDTRRAWLAAKDALKRRPRDPELRSLVDEIGNETGKVPEVPDPFEDIPGLGDLPEVPRPRMLDPLEALMGQDPFGPGVLPPAGARPGSPNMPEPLVPEVPGGPGKDRR